MLKAQAFARAASASASAAEVAPPSAAPAPVGRAAEVPPSVRQKRPRTYPETGEITAATAMLLQAAGGRRDSSQSRESSQSPHSDRSGGDGERTVGSRHSNGGSGGSPATGDGRSPEHSPCKAARGMPDNNTLVRMFS